MEALLRQGRCMVDNRLFVTLDGPNVNESGVSAEDFVTVLRGMQRAMRLVVEHLGQRSPGPGQPPRWVQEQSRLQLLSTRQGSLVAELTLEQRPAFMIKSIGGGDASRGAVAGEMVDNEYAY